MTKDVVCLKQVLLSSTDDDQSDTPSSSLKVVVGEGDYFVAELRMKVMLPF